jgi:hypothetical protein
MNMICKICSTSSSLFSKAVVREKYDVAYYRCTSCGFIQTEEPYWLDEAYATPINREDIGLVSRNMMLAAITQALIAAFFDIHGKYIDYGGGYGLFVRMMRDKGFDFYLLDKHCDNIFSHNFEVADSGTDRYELLTSFEVLEHLVDPLGEINNMLQYSGSLLVTTDLLPSPPPALENWWYYGLDHGQHVSFYTLQALATLAKKSDLRLSTNGRNLHLLTRKSVPFGLFSLLSRHRVARLCAPFIRTHSLIPADYKKITGKDLL